MKFIFFLLFFSLSCCIKNDNKNNNNFKISNTNKECMTYEACRLCTFEELKTEEECSGTGYKKRIHCLYEGKKEVFYSESCNENTTINSVYIMFFVCALLCFCAWRLQKNQKESAIKDVFSKLSIFKDN